MDLEESWAFVNHFVSLSDLWSPSPKYASSISIEIYKRVDSRQKTVHNKEDEDFGFKEDEGI